VSRINEKLGLGAAGQRRMMKLPADRQQRTVITSAVCPLCNRRGASVSKTVRGALWCTWCAHTWTPTEPPA
jgi:hypothetical protein